MLVFEDDGTPRPRNFPSSDGEFLLDAMNRAISFLGKTII